MPQKVFLMAADLTTPIISGRVGLGLKRNQLALITRYRVMVAGSEVVAAGAGYDPRLYISLLTIGNTLALLDSEVAVGQCNMPTEATYQQVTDVVSVALVGTFEGVVKPRKIADNNLFIAVFNATVAATAVGQATTHILDYDVFEATETEIVQAMTV